MCGFFFSFRFGIKYKFNIKFRFKFFKHFFHSKIPVLFIFSCGEFKFLLSLRRYITWGQFVEFSRNFKFLTIIGKNLVSMEFGGFLRRKVDFNGNLRLIDLSGFLRLLFGVKIIYYRVFLFVMGASK